MNIKEMEKEITWSIINKLNYTWEYINNLNLTWNEIKSKLRG